MNTATTLVQTSTEDYLKTKHDTVERKDRNNKIQRWSNS